jgi:hypothetical protein
MIRIMDDRRQRIIAVEEAEFQIDSKAVEQEGLVEFELYIYHPASMEYRMPLGRVADEIAEECGILLYKHLDASIGNRYLHVNALEKIIQKRMLDHVGKEVEAFNKQVFSDH